jgi:hypothetical protein
MVAKITPSTILGLALVNAMDALEHPRESGSDMVRSEQRQETARRATPVAAF